MIRRGLTPRASSRSTSASRQRSQRPRPRRSRSAPPSAEPVGERLAIAQVTPFAWELPSEVNQFAAKVGEELCRRGHRVAIVAPSTSAEKVREGRRLIRSTDEVLLRDAEEGPVLVAVGEELGGKPNRRRLALPSDTTRTLGELFDQTPFDICHLHEPFAPSITSAALRSSNALNVGTFHAPAERLVAT
ncbi:MAG: glycosyltransferase, partial [Actinobacteria bacterium]|nr:glycosyltransferase [Actinomycetota bacterium]